MNLRCDRLLNEIQMRALILLFMSLSANAQTALPEMLHDSPGAMYHHISPNGACVWWYAQLPTFTASNQNGVELNVYCANKTELPKIGGRVQTIISAADPLKSLQTLRKRITMSRIQCSGLTCSTSDPALTSVVAEMNSVRADK